MSARTGRDLLLSTAAQTSLLLLQGFWDCKVVTETPYKRTVGTTEWLGCFGTKVVTHFQGWKLQYCLVRGVG